MIKEINVKIHAVLNQKKKTREVKIDKWYSEILFLEKIGHIEIF